MKNIKRIFLNKIKPQKQRDISKLFIAGILVFLMVIMACIRIIPFYSDVFTKWVGAYGYYVNFAYDDPLYHMRLVQNTLHHFPWRIFFDPFTYFPFGTKIHFGPLYTLLISSFALIIGLGRPSVELANHVGAYFPVFLGALCIIPVYFVSKKMFGRGVGVFSAIVFAFLPGAFLDRSRLGYTDHHVAEVLFSTTMIAFLVYAINDFENIKLRLQNMANKKWFIDTKKPLIYALLAGFSCGLYILTWPAGLMFTTILLLFFITQMILDHINGRSTDYLMISASPLYFIPVVMVLPYAFMNPIVELNYYSLVQPILLVVTFLIVLFMYLISRILNKFRLAKVFYPISLVLILILFGLAIYVLNPEIIKTSLEGFKMLFSPSKGMQTVAEVIPSLKSSNNATSFQFVWNNFFFALPISIALLPIIIYRSLRQGSKNETMLFVWTLCILFSTLAQRRFAYYFAVNVAILTGYFGWSVFELLGVKMYMEAFRKVRIKFNIWKFLKEYNAKTVILGLFIILFLIVASYPLFIKGSSSGFLYMKLIGRKYPSSIGIQKEFYDALFWMKNHTPNQGGKKDFDYAGGMYSAPKDVGYRYPKYSYGVMAWWDYGHAITYISERIPNTNPFQEGVSETKNMACEKNIIKSEYPCDIKGAASFFFSDNERDAVKILESVGSRYVIVDNYLVKGKFQSIFAWISDSEKNKIEGGLKRQVTLKIGSKKMKNFKLSVGTNKLNNLIVNKMYYDDSNGFEHLRLVYESPGQYVVDSDYISIEEGGEPIYSHLVFNNANYKKLFGVYEQGKNPSWINKEKTVFAFNAKPPAKFVKVFERVKGAVLVGKAVGKKRVQLFLPILVGDGRQFVYSQETTSEDSGKYTFIVPYPTEKIEGDGYSYDVKAMTKYIIETGLNHYEVKVPERAVMKGEVIMVR